MRTPYLFLTLALLTTLGAAPACRKDGGKKKNDDKKTDAPDGADDGGDADGPDDDTGGGDDGNPTGGDPLKDEFQGVYQLLSEVETPYDDCNGAETPVTFNPLTPFFKLDTVYEITMEPTSEPKIDLWLYECTDERTCQGQVMNFLFPEKVDGKWGGQTSLSVGEHPFEPGKCQFSYTEREGTLTGKNLLIVTTSYTGTVPPIGDGCLSRDGGADVYEYYAAHRGRLACSGRETVKALKLDVPVPE